MEGDPLVTEFIQKWNENLRNPLETSISKKKFHQSKSKEDAMYWANKMCREMDSRYPLVVRNLMRSEEIFLRILMKAAGKKLPKIDEESSNQSKKKNERKNIQPRVNTSRSQRRSQLYKSVQSSHLIFNAEYRNKSIWSAKSFYLENLLRPYINIHAKFPNLDTLMFIEQGIDIGIMDTYAINKPSAPSSSLNNTDGSIHGTIHDENRSYLTRIYSVWSETNERFSYRLDQINRKEVDGHVLQYVNEYITNQWLLNNPLQTTLDEHTMSKLYEKSSHSQRSLGNKFHPSDFKVRGILHAVTHLDQIHVRPLCTSADVVISMHELLDASIFRYGYVQLPHILDHSFTRNKRENFRYIYRVDGKCTCYSLSRKPGEGPMVDLEAYTFPSYCDLRKTYDSMDLSSHPRATEITSPMKSFVDRIVRAATKYYGVDNLLSYLVLDMEECSQLNKIRTEDDDESHIHFRLLDIADIGFMDRIAKSRRNAIHKLSSEQKQTLRKYHISSLSGSLADSDSLGEDDDGHYVEEEIDPIGGFNEKVAHERDPIGGWSQGSNVTDVDLLARYRVSPSNEASISREELRDDASRSLKSFPTSSLINHVESEYTFDLNDPLSFGFENFPSEVLPNLSTFSLLELTVLEEGEGVPPQPTTHTSPGIVFNDSVFDDSYYSRSKVEEDTLQSPVPTTSKGLIHNDNSSVGATKPQPSFPVNAKAVTSVQNVEKSNATAAEPLDPIQLRDPMEPLSTAEQMLNTMNQEFMLLQYHNIVAECAKSVKSITIGHPPLGAMKRISLEEVESHLKTSNASTSEFRDGLDKAAYKIASEMEPSTLLLSFNIEDHVIEKRKDEYSIIQKHSILEASPPSKGRIDLRPTSREDRSIGSMKSQTSRMSRKLSLQHVITSEQRMIDRASIPRSASVIITSSPGSSVSPSPRSPSTHRPMPTHPISSPSGKHRSKSQDVEVGHETAKPLSRNRSISLDMDYIPTNQTEFISISNNMNEASPTGLRPGPIPPSSSGSPHRISRLFSHPSPSLEPGYFRITSDDNEDIQEISYQILPVPSEERKEESGNEPTKSRKVKKSKKPQHFKKKKKLLNGLSWDEELNQSYRLGLQSDYERESDRMLQLLLDGIDPSLATYIRKKLGDEANRILHKQKGQFNAKVLVGNEIFSEEAMHRIQSVVSDIVFSEQPFMDELEEKMDADTVPDAVEGGDGGERDGLESSLKEKAEDIQSLAGKSLPLNTQKVVRTGETVEKKESLRSNTSPRSASSVKSTRPEAIQPLNKEVETPVKPSRPRMPTDISFSDSLLSLDSNPPFEDLLLLPGKDTIRKRLDTKISSKAKPADNEEDEVMLYDDSIQFWEDGDGDDERDIQVVGTQIIDTSHKNTSSSSRVLGNLLDGYISKDVVQEIIDARVSENSRYMGHRGSSLDDWNASELFIGNSWQQKIKIKFQDSIVSTVPPSAAMVSEKSSMVNAEQNELFLNGNPICYHLHQSAHSSQPLHIHTHGVFHPNRSATNHNTNHTTAMATDPATEYPHESWYRVAKLKLAFHEANAKLHKIILDGNKLRTFDEKKQDTIHSNRVTIHRDGRPNPFETISSKNKKRTKHMVNEVEIDPVLKLSHREVIVRPDVPSSKWGDHTSQLFRFDIRLNDLWHEREVDNHSTALSSLSSEDVPFSDDMSDDTYDREAAAVQDNESLQVEEEDSQEEEEEEGFSLEGENRGSVEDINLRIEDMMATIPMDDFDALTHYAIIQTNAIKSMARHCISFIVHQAIVHLQTQAVNASQVVIRPTGNVLEGPDPSSSSMTASNPTNSFMKEEHVRPLIVASTPTAVVVNKSNKSVRTGNKTKSKTKASHPNASSVKSLYIIAGSKAIVPHSNLQSSAYSVDKTVVVTTQEGDRPSSTKLRPRTSNAALRSKPNPLPVQNAMNSSTLPPSHPKKVHVFDSLLHVETALDSMSTAVCIPVVSYQTMGIHPSSGAGVDPKDGTDHRMIHDATFEMNEVSGDIEVKRSKNEATAAATASYLETNEKVTEGGQMGDDLSHSVASRSRSDTTLTETIHPLVESIHTLMESTIHSPPCPSNEAVDNATSMNGNYVPLDGGEPSSIDVGLDRGASSISSVAIKVSRVHPIPFQQPLPLDSHNPSSSTDLLLDVGGRFWTSPSPQPSISPSLPSSKDPLVSKAKVRKERHLKVLAIEGESSSRSSPLKSSSLSPHLTSNLITYPDSTTQSIRPPSLESILLKYNIQSPSNGSSGSNGSPIKKQPTNHLPLHLASVDKKLKVTFNFKEYNERVESVVRVRMPSQDSTDTMSTDHHDQMLMISAQEPNFESSMYDSSDLVGPEKSVGSFLSGFGHDSMKKFIPPPMTPSPPPFAMPTSIRNRNKNLNIIKIKRS